MKTNPRSLQKQHGYKPQNTEYKLKQYKLKVLKVSPLQNDEKLRTKSWLDQTSNQVLKVFFTATSL